MFRVIVQDSRRTPTSGKVVAHIGSYDPHAKTVTLQKDKASFYLEHGARPSERVVKLLVGEGVKLPAWVKEATPRQGATRKPEKLRKNQPVQEAPQETQEPAPKTDEEQPASATPEAKAVTEPVAPEGQTEDQKPETATSPVEDKPEADQGK